MENYDSASGGTEGYEGVDINHEDNSWAGLEKNTGTYSLLDGSVNIDNWYYAVGSTEEYKFGIPSFEASESKVELWVCPGG